MSESTTTIQPMNDEFIKALFSKGRPEDRKLARTTIHSLKDLLVAAATDPDLEAFKPYADSELTDELFMELMELPGLKREEQPTRKFLMRKVNPDWDRFHQRCLWEMVGMIQARRSTAGA